MSYNQDRGLLGWNLSKATWWHHRYYANLLSLNQHVSNVSSCPTIIIWMTQSCDYFLIPVCIGRKPCRIFHFTKWLSLSPILNCCFHLIPRYSDVVMSAMASQITSLMIVYSTVYSDADKKKHQRSAPLAFVREIHCWPVNSSQKGPATRKMILFRDIIMDFIKSVVPIRQV